MRKSDLYTAAGWIDADLIVHNPAPFVLAIGGRGIGKSYGVLKMLYEERTPFIYMRRTQSQLDAVTVSALSPYNQINADCGYNIISQKMSQYTIGFYDSVPDEKGKPIPDGTPFSIGIALSTFASVRGLSAERYKVLLFDEIIPERHEKKLKEEELAFSNALESLNRNRELLGNDPLKVIMLSNSNTLNSRIISALGCTDVLEQMARKGTVYKVINNDIAIIRYEDSPISERKAKTALYRVIQNRDFQQMSLENEFAAADYEQVKQFPLQEFNMIVSIGDCTICRHKSKNIYYTISGAKANTRFTMLPIEKKAFQKAYYYIFGAYQKKRVYFQNATCKIEFEKGFDL